MSLLPLCHVKQVELLKQVAKGLRPDVTHQNSVEDAGSLIDIARRCWHERASDRLPLANIRAELDALAEANTLDELIESHKLEELIKPVDLDEGEMKSNAIVTSDK